MTKKNYEKFLSSELSADYTSDISAIDLYSGCGGLSLGFESEGIITNGYDGNQKAVDTYNTNLRGVAVCQQLDTSTDYANYDLLLAGPPCQPYSAAGKKLGKNDSRDGVPAVLKAIERIRPKVFVIENVKGLFKNLTLIEYITSFTKNLGYKIDIDILNANNFNVPQNRERLFIIGNLNSSEFVFPQKTQVKITVGEAIGKVRSAVPSGTKLLTSNIDSYIAKYELASKCRRPRDLHLDLPSRTITCRNLSGSTGDMMRLKLKDGRRRTLSVREAATLQSFPYSFKFSGSQKDIFNQIGNAVPPLMAKAIAIEIKQQFFS